VKQDERTDQIAQRDRLLEKFTVMQADLGGAFYEMAIRDHLRLDVLTRKAAELQRVDAELIALERVLELERSDAAGLCPSCGSPYGHGVRFCAQCGHSLTPEGTAK
jgi:zinc-ribbon domain